jgi:hypothetical protein
MADTKCVLDANHLATFEWYTKEWASHFGVDLRWLIHVRWSQDSGDSAAAVWYNDEARHAVVELRQDYDGSLPFSEEVLARFACHEVIHVLLAPLAELADLGAPRGVKTIGIEHEIVQTLMQISMRDHYDNMRARCPLKA